jgi:hypothetical protein
MTSGLKEYGESELPDAVLGRPKRRWRPEKLVQFGYDLKPTFDPPGSNRPAIIPSEPGRTNFKPQRTNPSVEGCRGQPRNATRVRRGGRVVEESLDDLLCAWRLRSYKVAYAGNDHKG